MKKNWGKQGYPIHRSNKTSLEKESEWKTETKERIKERKSERVRKIERDYEKRYIFSEIWAKLSTGGRT